MNKAIRPISWIWKIVHLPTADKKWVDLTNGTITGILFQIARMPLKYSELRTRFFFKRQLLIVG